MSKLAFFFVTLIAALPAAYLGFLSVMGFLGHSGEMPVVLMGVTGVSLLVCAAVVVMPVAVLLRRSPPELKTEGDEAEREGESSDGGSGEVVAEEIVEEDEVIEEDEIVEEDTDGLEYDDEEDFDAFDDEDDDDHKTR